MPGKRVVMQGVLDTRSLLENSVLITGNLKHFPLDRPVEVVSLRLALDKSKELS